MYSVPILSTSSQALFLSSANKEKKFAPTLPAIQVGTDITVCQNQREYKLYTFTPPTTGVYTISLLRVDGSDPDLFISYPGGKINTDYLLFGEDVDINEIVLYYGTNGTHSDDIITETFEGGRVYEVMVLQFYGSCFRLTVDSGSPPLPPFPAGDYVSFLNFTMFVDSGNHLQTPIISDPTTWGTKDSTLLEELITTGTACLLANGTLVPYKVDSKWDYINLYVAGFYTAPLSGSYRFTISSDDGVSIKLNEVIILSQPGYGNPYSESTDAITLTAGRKYPLEILWSNGAGALRLCITATVVNDNGTNIQITYPFNDSCSPTP